MIFNFAYNSRSMDHIIKSSVKGLNLGTGTQKLYIKLLHIYCVWAVREKGARKTKGFVKGHLGILHRNGK